VAIEVGRHDTASIGRRAAHPYDEMKEKLHDHKSATRLDMHRQCKSSSKQDKTENKMTHPMKKELLCLSIYLNSY
jgi:hypothetical protein